MSTTREVLPRGASDLLKPNFVISSLGACRLGMLVFALLLFDVYTVDVLVCHLE